MNSYEVLWLNPRLSKKNFRGHAASLFKVQPTYCFLLFFYSPRTTLLLNSFHQVLPSDFWLNIKSKKSKCIEYIRITVTKPRIPKKLSCTCRHATQSTANLLLCIVLLQPLNAASLNISREVLRSVFWLNIKIRSLSVLNIWEILWLNPDSRKKTFLHMLPCSSKYSLPIVFYWSFTALIPLSYRS